MGEYRNILSGSAPLLLGIQGTTLLVATRFRATQTTRASQGFFTDLISEGGEPEIARLQMLVWNFILGIVFIWQSVFQWAMPTFDPTLMTLLGLARQLMLVSNWQPIPKKSIDRKKGSQ